MPNMPQNTKEQPQPSQTHEEYPNDPDKEILFA